MRQHMCKDVDLDVGCCVCGEGYGYAIGTLADIYLETTDVETKRRAGLALIEIYGSVDAAAFFTDEASGPLC